MHLHAHSLEEYGGAQAVCTNEGTITFPGFDPRQAMTLDKVAHCDSMVPSPNTDEAVMTESIAMLEHYNIWAVTSGSLDRVSNWRAAAQGRVIPAISPSKNSAPYSLNRSLLFSPRSAG